MSKETKNRRKESRSLCSELVRIAFQDQRGETVVLTGLLEDVNRSGICISVSHPVGIDTEIEFECEGFDGAAAVKYCHLGNYGYLIGATFAEGLVWDESTWRPRHLLSLAEPGR